MRWSIITWRSDQLLIKELQIQTTMSYHNTSIRMAQIKRLTALNIGKNVEKYNLSYIVDRSQKELALYKMPSNLKK